MNRLMLEKTDLEFGGELTFIDIAFEWPLIVVDDFVRFQSVSILEHLVTPDELTSDSRNLQMSAFYVIPQSCCSSESLGTA